MPASAASTLVARTSCTSRVHVVGIAVLVLAGRIGVVATALYIASADARIAVIAGVVSGGIYVLRRIVHGAARVFVERDLHHAVARKLLEVDVFAVDKDLHRVAFDTIHHGHTLVTSTLPTLAAEALAASIMVVVLLRAFPARVLLMAGAGLGAVLFVVLVTRRSVKRLQGQLVDAYGGVLDTMALALEGRIEIVAQGQEERTIRAVDTTLDRYTMLARRTAFASAILGRAPLAAGAIAIATIAVADGSSREALMKALLGQAVVLAACAAPLLGLVTALFELIRMSALVRPLAELLSAAKRPELQTRNTQRVALPASFSTETVAFAYDRGASILTEVSLDWPVGKTLAIEGPNGSGKSTLLRLLLGLRRPDSGVVRIDARDLAYVDAIAMRTDIAYLPQRAYLGQPHATVREALGLAEPEVGDPSMLKALARTHFDRTAPPGTDLLALSVGTLSAGQRQRAALARVLLRRAQMVLLDEPDANLDRDGVAMVATLVREMSASGKMVAFVAHTAGLTEVADVRLELSSRGMKGLGTSPLL